MNFNNLSDLGMANLVPCKWHKLKHLSLLANNIGNAGITALAKMHFPHLEVLQLSHNALTDDSMIPLVKGKWRQLKTL